VTGKANSGVWLSPILKAEKDGDEEESSGSGAGGGSSGPFPGGGGNKKTAKELANLLPARKEIAGLLSEGKISKNLIDSSKGLEYQTFYSVQDFNDAVRLIQYEG